MGADQFYTSNNLEKYPEDGKLPQCKKCITMHVDNWNPDTYMWILQECDVPYIPDEWNKLMNTYAKDRKKVTGTTIIGRYLSKMKLKQWRDYRWKDTEFLQDMANKKIEETMKRSGYDAQQIAAAIERASITIPDKPLEEPDPNDFLYEEPIVEEDDLDLTEEDKIRIEEIIDECSIVLYSQNSANNESNLKEFYNKTFDILKQLDI